MKNYIPKHNSDLKAAKYLVSLPFETVRTDVLEILESIQDMHWDIAHVVAPYLIPHVNEIKDELLLILNDNDEGWKYNVIRSLIAYSKEKLDQDLINIIKRIAENPTEAEIEDLVEYAAKDVISNKFLCG